MRGRLRRGLITLGLLALSLLAFRGVELLAHPRFSFQTPLDDAIPFVPASIFIYQAFFFWVIGAAMWLPEAAGAAMWRRMALAVGIGLLFFLLLPASMARPDLAGISSDFVRQRFIKLRALDASHNTFPSLHVAITWIAATALWKEGARWGALGAATAITLSTLTVKQHTLADVAGGLLLCALVCALEPRLSAQGKCARPAVDRPRGNHPPRR